MARACDHKFLDATRCAKCGWSPVEDAAPPQCSHLDHVYPGRVVDGRPASPAPGTPCACGRRRWAEAIEKGR